MKIVSVRILSVATLALAPMLIAAGQGSIEKVRVQAIEPARAAHLQQSVSGNCYGRKVVVDFIHHSSSKFAAVDTVMKVTVDGKVHSFGASEAFVRDLASGSPFAHQDWIYCDNDPNRQILLVALGFTAPGITTVAPGEPHAAPTIQRAKITFARDGSFVTYSGLQPAE
jgi:hypothetical protein